MKYQFASKFVGGSTLLGALLGLDNLGSAANFVGDGRDELVIGAPGESPGASPRSGGAYVFVGSGYGVSPSEFIDQGGLDINEPGDQFGSAFAAGDFNGDGFDDLAVGAPGEAPGLIRSGAVFVFRGTAGGLEAHSKHDQTGMGRNDIGDRFGESMVAADFNNDGFDDLVVGAPGEELGTGFSSGAVYLFLGSPKGLLPVRAFDQAGLGVNEAGDMFASALAAGDFDGDGFADLAVGAPGEAPGSDPRSGVVFIFRGNTTGLAPDVVLDQTPLGVNEEDDQFGFALVSGDFNDDGRDDLAVGAPGEAPGPDARAGAVFIFRGSAKGLTARQTITQKGFGYNEPGDRFGHALTAGDYNGDGRDELAVGAPGKLVGSMPNAGTVFVFRGDKTNLVSLQALTQTGLGANEANERFGSRLASGNYIGDFREDLAVGVPGEAPGSDSPVGAVYLFRGYALGLATERIVDQTGLDSDEAGDMFGAAILD